jgi:regulator of sigma E protease
VKLPFFQAIYYGFKDMVLTSKNVVIALYSIIAGLFKTGKVSEAISGPVGIFNITGQAVQLGFIYIIQLAALLSINLAIINILPFPGLDGSRALIIFLEGVFRKKVIRTEIESVLHMIGFILLILLILLVTFKDILAIV